uniref:hypothetical protein n=1 Tax=Thaumasiovibrio occultus TaxID=1891184 RepID=UPI00192D1703|nr:hypothetical protein [Thaumasiovibrio occultus]
MFSNATRAISILDANRRTRHGIFRFIGAMGYFPPHAFLNTFLAKGHDLCDQDGEMASWMPFQLTPAEYDAVATWWVSLHPKTVVDDLSAEDWQEWVQAIIED